MSLSNHSNIVNLLDGDDDSGDELLNQGPIFKRAVTPADVARNSVGATTSFHHSNTATALPPTKKRKSAIKPKKPTKGFALLWICTHGKGRRSSWRQKDLKIVGVYPTKEKAQEAKQQVMSEHDCYGHGDICVGGTWEDEIDLVIRDTPLYLE